MDDFSGAFLGVEKRCEAADRPDEAAADRPQRELKIGCATDCTRLWTQVYVYVFGNFCDRVVYVVFVTDQIVYIF